VVRQINYRDPQLSEEVDLSWIMAQEPDCPQPEQQHPAFFVEYCLYRVRPTKKAAMAMIVKTMIVSSMVSLKVFLSGIKAGREIDSDIENRCQVSTLLKNDISKVEKN